MNRIFPYDCTLSERNGKGRYLDEILSFGLIYGGFKKKYWEKIWLAIFVGTKIIYMGTQILIVGMKIMFVGEVKLYRKTTIGEIN